MADSIECKPFYRKNHITCLLLSAILISSNNHATVCLCLGGGNPTSCNGRMNICTGCNEPIEDRFLMKVVDEAWHESCLQCCICRSPLSRSCFSKDRKLYCRTDYEKWVALNRIHPSITIYMLEYRYKGQIKCLFQLIILHTVFTKSYSINIFVSNSSSRVLRLTR